MRRLLVIGRHIFVRTAALMGAFVLAGAVVARSGDASLAAHQIAFQLWVFLALVLDAVAIAGQVLVGRGLGAGDVERAYAASTRMIWLSVYAGGLFAVVLLLLQGVLPYVFTSDEAVVERAQAIWWLFALMQPLNGAVFALDGILIGASDGRYLMWSMVAAFVASGVGRARRARVRLGDRRRLGGAGRPDLRPVRADVAPLRGPALARYRLGLIYHAYQCPAASTR